VQLGSDFPKPYTTDAEEEKRLYYVAMTRAKKVLNGVRYYKDDAGDEAVKFNFNKLIRSLENESYVE
jgi:ATP-dependent exoDNAse (exonuclease V) beta subunit